jgi:uncharacterized membrane protein YqaE (UPF0057 family)
MRARLRSILAVVIPPVAVLVVSGSALALFVAGATWVGYLVAFIGAGALGTAARNRWQVRSGPAWTVAVVFGVALIFPGAWLGQDIALSAHSFSYHGVVVSITHTPGPHSTTDVADVRIGPEIGAGTTGSGAPQQDYVQLRDTNGLSVGSHVDVLVDPTGAVDPARADDLHTVRDSVLFGLGVVVAALALLWWRRQREPAG